ncbi:uncharacterized protein C8A04DRAFT_38252 [Dichotomopilus funicola]|uniref:NmrA-like domain-containing protein n=1 Tax=Dichotomopilus funicola TaxID=1934379 RepID=A0AAN6V2R2_9PEZI|nr:hypothetical protein C8A04DRAFT_38252 [Dichotomopilus funicola]
MVKIAIAGGAGNVGQEIIDVLAATNKHDILVLSRKDATPNDLPPTVTWVKTDYTNLDRLTQTLRGVDTVLSFITAHMDPGSVAQKSLIDAAVRAGVRRFAPSEWASSSFEHMPWNDGKAVIREYLAELNKEKKILEYTLFQPGLFTNYLTHPYRSTKHIQPIETPFDLARRRALVVQGRYEEARITLTTVADLAQVVVRAVEYEGPWPVVGGIRGDDMTLRKVVEMGERVRGGKFTVEKLNADDLKAGVVKSSWMPQPTHPSFTPEEIAALAQRMTAGIVLGISSNTLSVSDEWNQLLPDYEFTKAEKFLREQWRGKELR